jgi:diguanylate cyclase (GGDEF)-like protein/PAS domain S-box-containing protein
MDVRMPELNGFDACRQLRERSRTAHTPVLMLTALDDVMAVTLAFEAGATDFVTKPINWTLLAQRVRYALRTSAIERDLRLNQAALAQAHRMARLGRCRLDLRSGLCHGGADFQDLLGLPGSSPVPAREIRRHLPPDDRRRVRRYLHALRCGERVPDVEFRWHDAAGHVRYFALAADAEPDDSGRIVGLHGVIQDVTARRSAEARLSYHAHFDELTGLPNRVLFRDRVASAIAHARSEGRRLAVFAIDVDVRHKADAGLGLDGTDRMLRSAARRLQGVARERDTLSRMDGRTFALLLSELPEERQAAQVGSRLVGAFGEPLSVGEREVLIGAVVGIAVYPTDGEDVDTLLLRASTAKTRAHQAEDSGYQFYTADMQRRVLSRLSTEVALYRGLERGEFELQYQPKVDLKHGRTMGVEALLRWNRPNEGLQSPDSFIPLLEQTGLIMETGDWVLRAACTAMLPMPLSLAVNMSPTQFRHPRVAERLSRILEETGFPAARLELEITEQVVMHDESGAVATLRELRALGIRISLDDYGTGFSSLQRLKGMPLHSLKIDKTFITALPADREDQAIVRSTIELCHQLGIVVVAEGVEDDATMRLLERLGCDVVQGYGICRPLSLPALAEWLGTSDFAPWPAP